MINKLRALLEAATPGPWEREYSRDITVRRENDEGTYWEPLFRGGAGSEEDAELIVEMRNCLPALLDRLEKLEAVVEVAQDLKETGDDISAPYYAFAQGVDNLFAALAALEESK